ncbi:hypothetical protein J31TS4_30200 [Paenibacillus sp. J31TS4]|uniref:hypothetical protein n=1 Tax=Paenibacillus sp. J31TS4 TaxID=2807195 RepID=UPI001B1B1FB0|nr:hypothetical protein [Paenibacillus sp. J31TS4]GIP39740.1 hypothetical protein J31TS4_30200 [Paenibacillus sp. J31TS4]
MSELEGEVAEYITAATLAKVLRWDRQYAGMLPLGAYWSRAWPPLLGLVEQECRSTRRRLGARGCRILAEDLGEDKCVRVRYLHAGMESTCTLLPVLLKRRCEAMLTGLLVGRQQR